MGSTAWHCDVQICERELGFDTHKRRDPQAAVATRCESDTPHVLTIILTLPSVHPNENPVSPAPLSDTVGALNLHKLDYGLVGIGGGVPLHLLVRMHQKREGDALVERSTQPRAD